MSGDVAVEARHLSKSFRLHRERRHSFKERLVRGRPPSAQEFWALDDVSFSIRRGSFLGIIGHNGSGKSTALKVLAGIYRPTRGSVEVHGRVSALLELGAGFHPDLTGRENIQLNGAILGLSRREIAEAEAEIIDFAGIGDFIDSPVKVYSSGMAVRLGFSVAVKVDPEILIVDEVIAVGDEEFQRKCLDYLFRLRNKGSTIIMVSHSMGSVENMCDTALWLDQGRVQAMGRPGKVVRRYLDRVNRDEAERRAPASDAPAVDKNRSGSGEARITDLKVLSVDGQVGDLAISGEPVTFRLAYQASQDLDGVDFGLGFVHEAGTMVGGPNSRAVGPYRLNQGRGTIEFHVDDLLLEPGNYWISTAIVIGEHMIDHVDRGFDFKIRGLARGGAGLVALPGNWTEPSPDLAPTPVD